jgi:regulator of sigma E protease
MNFVLALLIFIYSYTFIGIPQATDEPIIGMVFEGQPAEAAVCFQVIAYWRWMECRLRTGRNLPAAYRAGSGYSGNPGAGADGQQQQLEVITEENPNTGLSIIGVSSQVIYEKQGLLTAIKIGLQQTYELTLVLLGPVDNDHWWGLSS